MHFRDEDATAVEKCQSICVNHICYSTTSGYSDILSWIEFDFDPGKLTDLPVMASWRVSKGASATDAMNTRSNYS
jgi:hypothetical protein